MRNSPAVSNSAGPLRVRSRAQKESPVPAGLGLSFSTSFEARPLQFAPGQWSEPMEFSYPNLGKTILPPMTDEQARDAVADVIGPYSNAYLAKKAGGRTPEAGKKWKARAAAPSLAPTINMASSIPAVEWMLRTEIELRKRGGDPSRFVTELVTDLMRLAEGDGPQADRARRALNDIGRLLLQSPPDAPAVNSQRPVSASFHHGEAVERERVPSELAAGGFAISPSRSVRGAQ